MINFKWKKTLKWATKNEFLLLKHLDHLQNIKSEFEEKKYAQICVFKNFYQLQISRILLLLNRK